MYIYNNNNNKEKKKKKKNNKKKNKKKQKKKAPQGAPGARMWTNMTYAHRASADLMTAGPGGQHARKVRTKSFFFWGGGS